MRSSRDVVVGATTSTAGPSSLTQGVYGARGNLELVACDRADGLWVFWFNADPVADAGDVPDVPPGTWSAGLRFAEGHRYLDAQIVQSTLGPDHLEVLALAADGVLQSWYWSPGPGFQRRGTDAATAIAGFGLTHHDGTLAATVTGHDGAVRHLVSTPAGYPERAWATAAEGPGGVPDAAPAVVAAGIPASEIEPGTARACRSTRDGGTLELVWRGIDGHIRHLGVPEA